MPNMISGPGINLKFPQSLYPSQLQNAPQDASTNKIGLAPGDVFVVPAGDWYISLGLYNILQFLDPVTSQWQIIPGAAWTRGMLHITSDGFNVRVANLTGCVVSASVINGGTNYVQATTTITAIGAFQTGVAVPTLVPIVGGALGFTGTYSLDITTGGKGYGIAPIVMIPPPPPAAVNVNGVGGIPAEAVAILGASGSLTSVSLINPGAGYPSAPTPVIIPSPFDPNLTTGITQASVAFSLTSAGVIMGAFVTNNGGPLVNGSLGSVTLSIGGAGASGSLTANVLQTIVSGTLTSAGTGFSTGGAGFVTYGGAPLPGTITNSPEFEGLAFEPRQANVAVTAASLSVGAPATIYDGGLFMSAPSVAGLGLPTGGLTTVAGLTLLMGSRPDRIILQGL
jgi:hypothetical protein